MAYALPSDPVKRWALENLPDALLSYESGVNDSLSNEKLSDKIGEINYSFWVKRYPERFANLKFVSGATWQDKFNVLQNYLSMYEKIDSTAGQFFSWQFTQRLSPARLSAFQSWQQQLSSSRTGGLTDEFSGFIDRTNVIEIGVAAVAGAVAVAAVPAIGAAAASISAPSIPTASAISLPSLSEAGAAVGAAILDQAKKEAEKEIKNILAPNQIKPISDADVASEQFISQAERKNLSGPIIAGLAALTVLFFI